MSVTVLNTTASLSGRTLLKAEDTQTVTGQKTFDLGASAPFAVVSGAAKVTNLDADLLDGQEGTAYHDASLLTGVLPVTVVGADPNADRPVFWDDSANAFAFLTPSNAAIRGTSQIFPITDPCGRLTLTTGVPVTTTDVTAAGTLYWALYKGNTAQLYNGTTWETFSLAQLSIAVPAAANQVYDAFLDFNSGTPALTLTAWTNDTTRATALTTQDGVLVLTGTLGKRYVGTVRTVTASQLNDSIALRHVWNYYNRTPRELRVFPTGSWTYNTATFRQANAAAANQLDLVVGVAEQAIQVQLNVAGSNSTGGINFSVAIGYDSTSAVATGSSIGYAQPPGGILQQLTATLTNYPAAGRHIYVWLEKSGVTVTTTFYGVTGTDAQSGILALFPM